MSGIKICVCCFSANNLIKLTDSIIKMVVSCFLVQVDDFDISKKSPAFVCRMCIKKLKDCYSFKCRIVECQNKLKELCSMGNFNNTLNIHLHKNKRIESVCNEQLLSNNNVDDDDSDFREIKDEPEILEMLSIEGKKVAKIKTEPCTNDDLSNSNIEMIEVKIEPWIQNEVNKIEFKTDMSSNKKRRKSTRVTKSRSNNRKPSLLKKIMQVKDNRSFPKSHLLFKNNLKCLQPLTDTSEEQSAVICKLCNETFTSHKLLRTHMAVHYPNFICDQCGKTFLTKYGMTSHAASHNQKKVPCPECNRFISECYMKNHLRVHKNSMNYACPFCPERFDAFHKRIKHIKEVHKKTELYNYSCKLCPQVYKSASGLSNHVRNIHMNERKAICTICNRGFYNKVLLRNHMLTHTGEKNHTCNVCNKSFARKSTLVVHVRTHDNSLRYKCVHCNKEYSQKCTLRMHMKTHENNKESVQYANEITVPIKNGNLS